MGTHLRGVDMGGQLWKIELLDGATVWVPHESARSLAELSSLPTAEKRRLIVENAQRLIGDPYLWGGRSARPSGPDEGVTGVDCSGLVNLVYRAAGVQIPRDAHEQSLRAHPIRAPQAGDLIFLSERDNPARIVHVMLYAGGGDLIEGPGTGEAIRKLPVAKRLGRSMDGLASGAVVDGQTVSFGSYLL